jgi:hypothetical protein
MTETASDELLADLEEAMHDVVDPELGINVVDLGLVYGLNLEQVDSGTVAVIDRPAAPPSIPNPQSSILNAVAPRETADPEATAIELNRLRTERAAALDAFEREHQELFV